MMLHLLTETSIYVPLPNDCYAQLTGPPLIYSTLFQRGRLQNHAGSTNARAKFSDLSLKRKIRDSEEATKPKKRRKVELEKNKAGVMSRKEEIDERKV